MLNWLSGLAALCMLATAARADGLREWLDQGYPCSVLTDMRLSGTPEADGINPMSGDPPYSLQVLNELGHPVRFYQPGKEYTVILYGSVSFTGYILQARQADRAGFLLGNLPVGRFIRDDAQKWNLMGIQMVDCGNDTTTSDSAVTHAHGERKYGLKTRWAVDQNVGPVQFVAIIAKDPTIYWELWQPKAALLLPDGNAAAAITTTKAPAKQTPAKFKPILRKQTTAAPATEATESQEGDEVVELTQPAALQDDQLLTTAAAALSELQLLENEIAEKSSESVSDEIEGSGSTELDIEAANNNTLTVFTDDDDLVGGPKGENLQRVLERRRLIEAQQTTPKPTTTTRSPCLSVHCMNEGICVPASADTANTFEGGNRNFYCACLEGWTGEFCEQKDFCLEHDCIFGRCINGNDSYTCRCDFGYAGKKCDRDCPSHFCNNGGMCTIDAYDRYSCICPEGFAGSRCERNIDDCKTDSCHNGGTCLDRVNGFACICTDGWTGQRCDRPCADVYDQCSVWRKQRQCEEQKQTTSFFDDNCPLSCGQCMPSLNETDHQTTGPIVAPALQPLAWLIGEWNVERSYDKYIFPIDFAGPTATYKEHMQIEMSHLAFFGTPLLSLKSLAVSHQDESERFISGFLSIKNSPSDKVPIASLTTTTDTGLTIIEEGPIDGQKLELVPVYVGGPKSEKRKLPAEMKRTLSIESIFLKEALRKTLADGQEVRTVKYYRRKNTPPPTLGRLRHLSLLV